MKHMMGRSDFHTFGAKMVPPIHVEHGAYDFHNFLKVDLKGTWVTLDATFGVNEEPLAVGNNLHWNGIDDCQILFPVRDEFAVDDAFSAKAKLLETLTPAERQARVFFLLSSKGCAMG